VKKTLLILAACAACCGLAVAAPDPAAQKAEAEKKAEAERKAEERRVAQTWNALSFDEKKWIVRYCEVMREMPEAERRLINDRFDKFLRMTPEERTIMKQNYAKWQAMSPEEKQKARDEYIRHQKNYEAEWKKKHPNQPAPPIEFTVSTVPPDPGFYRDEFQLMILQLELQGDQLKAFQLKVAERLKALEDWEKSRKGRQAADLNKLLKASTQPKDAAKIKSLEAALAPLNQEYRKLRADQRAEVMSALTFEQQQKWAAYVLFDKVRHRNLRGFKLTNAQLEQAREICNEIAAKLVKPDTIRADPYLNAIDPLREDVANNIKANVLGIEPARAESVKPAPTSAVP